MKRILLIEDDLYIRDIYSRIFTNAGYSVEVAVDGEEGIAKTKDQAYDLVLLDIMLPKVTGIDVLKNFRQPSSTMRNTPVFLITNLGQDDIIKEAFDLGADGYLLKAQFKPQDIVEQIGAYFKQRETSSGQKQPPLQ